MCTSFGEECSKYVSSQMTLTADEVFFHKICATERKEGEKFKIQN